MLSNLFLQLTHIELLMSYSVKDILTLVKRDPRFTVKTLNDMYFEDSIVDESVYRLAMNNVVNWLYDRGENPDAFVQRIIDRCAAFDRENRGVCPAGQLRVKNALFAVAGGIIRVGSKGE